MIQTRDEAVARLLDSYQRYYNQTLLDDPESPVVARCEYFEHMQSYALTKRAELWSAKTEEFLYLINIPHLTEELFLQWRDWVKEDGTPRMNIGPGHMSSYITAIFLCDTCDDAARSAAKRCRIRKSFRFSLHGWMDYRAAVVELSSAKVTANAAARQSAENLKRVLGFNPPATKRKGEKT